MVLGVVDVNAPLRVRQRRPPHNTKAGKDHVPPTPPPVRSDLPAQPTPMSRTISTPRAVQHQLDRGTEQQLLPLPARAIGINTLRRFHAAHQPTPDKLRELEEGWRARRRISLSPDAPSPPGLPLKPAPVIAPGKPMERKVAETSAPTRRTVSFADPPIPPPPRRLETKATANRSFSAPNSQPQTSVLNAQPVNRRISAPAANLAVSQPRPILAHPLSSTPTPRPITSKSHETIHVPPDEPGRKYELMLRLDRRIILVRKGGESLVMRSSSTGASTSTPRKSRERTLQLAHSNSWTQKERDEWEAVERLMERTKRSTPRIKIYGAQGNICVTCSSPPDIVLGFALPTSGAGSAAQTSSRVRVAYSRLANELRIDTSTSTVAPAVHAVAKQAESLRTRRIVPLQPTPAPADAVYMGDKGLKDGEGVLRDAMRGFGISSMGEWRSEENEAVRRLWLSRKDWIGFS